MKSEKEKMLAGKPYRAHDLELEEERYRARLLIHQYNQLAPGETSLQQKIIRGLVGTCGEQFVIEAPFRCDYGYNIHLGENFYSNFNLVILDCAEVRIGNNALIGPDVGIYTAGHPVHPELRNKEYEFAFPVKIGNSVWIGGHVVINPGVTIGDNVVIGSGSVVTKDIPSGVIAMGNPCRVMREITEEDQKYYYKNLKFDES
jgi:acetyltransferase-like isoleucine patch superfamily enzyme